MPERSPTPLARTLGITARHRLALLGAPREWAVPDLPHDVTVVRRRSAARADVVVAFVRSLAALQPPSHRSGDGVAVDGALWIAWPRRAGGHMSDLTDNGVRHCVTPTGLVDVKVAALDDDWSALKFVWRLERRATLEASRSARG